MPLTGVSTKEESGLFLFAIISKIEQVEVEKIIQCSRKYYRPR